MACPTAIKLAGQQSGIPDTRSAGGRFSFESQTYGWLLCQTEALLRTVDGVHWTAISSVAPGV